jgi:hypothetical protein
MNPMAGGGGERGDSVDAVGSVNIASILEPAAPGWNILLDSCIYISMRLRYRIPFDLSDASAVNRFILKYLGTSCQPCRPFQRPHVHPSNLLDALTFHHGPQLPVYN